MKKSYCEAKLCVICNSETKENGTHALLGYKVLGCEYCGFNFVDTSSLTKEQTLKDQQKGIFGQNLSRNLYYSELLSRLQNSIYSILEIGTPKNYDLLKRIHNKYGKSYSLHCHDVFKPSLPDYVKFVSDIKKSRSSEFDLILCIHTLEHIPTEQLVEFVNNCRRISKYYIFEVPLCETMSRVRDSSSQPHYSFFTKESLKKLFHSSEGIFYKTTGNTIKLTNIDGLLR